nr:hypothetical protein [Bacillaceae bacterium]
MEKPLSQLKTFSLTVYEIPEKNARAIFKGKIGGRGRGLVPDAEFRLRHFLICHAPGHRRRMPRAAGPEGYRYFQKKMKPPRGLIRKKGRMSGTSSAKNRRG